MNDQEANIAVAEAIGRPTPFHGRKVDDVYDANWCPIPNYGTSLDAMHEAWKATNHTHYRQHWQELYQIVQRDYNLTHPNERFHYLHQHFRKALIANATAAQRREAFLRTLGKWKD